MRKIISKIGAVISSAALLISSVPTVTVNAEDEPKLLALAFDDGPNTTATNAVLDVLEQYNAKATFFVIGTNINDETAKSVKQAYDMGMEIANHSKTHNSMTEMTPDEIKAEDLVLLQKWLLAVPDTKLADWKAADFCKDDRLDVFDLCLMRRALLK